MRLKRLISAFIACAMLFTMVPSYALADDSSIPITDIAPATSAKDVEVYVPDTTACTMAEGCTAEVHQDGCPTAQPVADEPETETDQPFEPKSGTVAKIGDMKYESLDEALAHAKDGDIIEVMQDCETQNGFAVSGQDLTIQGNNKTITANEYGIYLAKKDDDPSRLTFEGCNLVFQPKQGTPMIAGEKYTWATVVINYDCELSFKDCNVTVTPAEEGQVNTGVYYHEGSKVNLDNTDMIVSGFSQNGFSADVNDQGLPYSSELNILRGSDMEVSHNRAGVTAAMQITVNDSTFDNSWNSGNASNGADYYMTNSTVNVSYNGYHGMSARNVRSINSTITCEENGGYGITCYGTVEVDGKSTIDVLKNSSKGDYAGLYLKGTSTIQSGATVTIAENECSGLSNRGTATFEDGVDLAVIGNYNDKGTTSQGGGVYNFSGGSLSLPKGAEIYNNHADDGADDIYSAVGCKIIFGQVGSGWILDDCGDDITGWYDDSEKKRWQGEKQPYYIDEFNQFDEYGLATVTGALALKAAHGRIIDIPDIPDPELPEPRVDKTATRLNAEDQTTVTLSIGAEQGKENVAVLFLLDKSTSQGMRDEAAKMLDELKTKTNTNILYNVVIFSGDATSTGWCNIQDDAALENTKENFVNKETSSGTNMVAGIQCAEEQMKSLPEEYGMTYLVTLSDGISYVWNDENGIKKTVYAAGLHHEGMVEVQPQNGADSWDIMYDYGMSLSDIYGGMNNFLEELPRKMENSINARYVQNYEGANPNNCIQTYVYDEAKKQEVAATYACAPEFAVYYSAMQYMDLASQFTRSYAFAVPELTESGADNQKSWDNFPWGKELMLFCQMQSSNCGQGAVSNTDAKEIFEDIRDEVLYAIKSGEVTDVIGRDFDLADVNSFVLTVGGTQIQPVHVDGNTVKFGEAKDNVYPYEVEYFPAANGAEEKFIWKINVPVENSKLLQLSYDLKLVNKSEFEGTYTVPTNENATLEYVPTQGDNGTMDFPVPTVSYTVEDPTITVTFKPGDHGDLRGAEAGADISYDGIKKGTGLGEDQAVPRVDEDKDWDFTNWLCIEGSAGMKDQTYTAAQIAELEFDVDTVFVAQYEEESSGGGAHHPEYDPDDDNDRDDDDDEEEIIDEEVPLAETPWLNTVDHYAYIVGYPEDYVTGQPTEDESRWPVKPQANISRAEVATIFFRLLTDEARDQFWMTTNNFPDVAPDAWYNNAISTMVNAGIIQGYEDGTFRPNNNITRAEFAAIASRFMSSGYDVEEDLFTDIANHWARENINDAAMTQWIHGYPDGTFLPDQAITRAEAVTLVNNVLQRKPHKDHMLDTMIKWPDNPESAWYYEAIQEATNSHDYDLFEDAEYETWTALQENRDWAALEKDWVNTHRTGGEVM